jgi:hypothetical protein
VSGDRELLAAAMVGLGPFLADTFYECTLHKDDAEEIADVLLPIVDRIATATAAAVLRAAAQEQRNEAEQVPDTDEGTHADGHRCAADFLDRRAATLDPT